MIDIVMTSTGRADLVEKTLSSFSDKMFQSYDKINQRLKNKFQKLEIYKNENI